jgi:hypothetical protein
MSEKYIKSEKRYPKMDYIYLEWSDRNRRLDILRKKNFITKTSGMFSSLSQLPQFATPKVRQI